jgi:hypothetical protein
MDIFHEIKEKDTVVPVRNCAPRQEDIRNNVCIFLHIFNSDNIYKCMFNDIPVERAPGKR